MQKPLPPGLAAAAIEDAAQGKHGSSLLWFLLLRIYGFAFLWLLNLRLRAEYLRRKSQRICPAQDLPRRFPAPHPSWNVPGLPGPVAAVFEKELRYLSRSGPMLFTLVVPLFMLLVFRSSGQNQALFAHAPELTFPLGAAYSLLLLTNLSYNNFGADGGGVQFFFASPAPFRQIIVREESGACGDFRPGGCAGMAGHQPALPGAVDQGYARHSGRLV